MPDKVNIDSKEWYDAMFAKVKEVLETLVLLDSAFVGYIQVPVEGQPITLSWTKSVVTVSIDKYKWQMPIGWFIEDDMIDKIVAVPQNRAQDEMGLPRRGPEHLDNRAQAARELVEQEQPRSGDREEDEPGPALALGDTLLGSRPRPHPGVRTVEEIMREQGLEDADD